MFWLSRDFDRALSRVFDEVDTVTTYEPYSKVTREDEGFHVAIDIPGVKKEDVKLNAEDRKLKVEAKRDDRQITWIRTLPRDAKIDGIEAKLEDGVLDLRIPFAESTSTSIQIA